MNLSRVFKFSLSRRQFQWVVVVAILSLVVGLYLTWVAGVADRAWFQKNYEWWYRGSQIDYSLRREITSVHEYYQRFANDGDEAFGVGHPLYSSAGERARSTSVSRSGGPYWHWLKAIPFLLVATVLAWFLFIRAVIWLVGRGRRGSHLSGSPFLGTVYTILILGNSFVLPLIPTLYLAHTTIAFTTRLNEERITRIKEAFDQEHIRIYNSVADGDVKKDDALLEMKKNTARSLGSMERHYWLGRCIEILSPLPEMAMIVLWQFFQFLLIITLAFCFVDFGLTRLLRARIDKLGYDFLNRDQCWILILSLGPYAWRLPPAEHFLVIPSHDKRSLVHHIIRLQLMRLRFVREYLPEAPLHSFQVPREGPPPER